MTLVDDFRRRFPQQAAMLGPAAEAIALDPLTEPNLEGLPETQLDARGLIIWARPILYLLKKAFGANDKQTRMQIIQAEIKTKTFEIKFKKVNLSKGDLEALAVPGNETS